jgi:hypothetical protein
MVFRYATAAGPEMSLYLRPADLEREISEIANEDLANAKASGKGFLVTAAEMASKKAARTQAKLDSRGLKF